MAASLEQVRAALSEEERAKFDESVNVLTFNELDVRESLIRTLTGRSPAGDRKKNVLHGKTANEVIDEADRILEERRKKEREQALGEIAELREKKDRSREARAQLKKFKVLRSRFYKERVGFLGPQPFVELSVSNETGQVVSRAHFIGTLSSANRSIPWLKERFSYRIEDNLNPGQEGTWVIPMNPFSPWGTTDLPDDAVLTLDVDELEGPGAQTLYSRRGFTEADARRLERLREKYDL